MPAEEDHARCWREHGQTNSPQSHRPRVLLPLRGNKEESALLIAAGSAFENATHKHIDYLNFTLQSAFPVFLSERVPGLIWYGSVYLVTTAGFVADQ